MGQEQGAAPSARGRRGVLGIVGIAAGVLVAVIMLVAGSVYAITESRFAKTYEVPKLALSVPGPSDTEAMARGKHLAVTRGCLECHAENGAGRLFIDEMPVMQLRPPNITPGGRVKTYSAADWERAIRHGVHPDGTPILFMPVEDYRMMADDDLADLIGYLKTLPAVENDPGPSTIGPVGRVLYLLGELPLTVADHLDHAAQVPPAPTRGPGQPHPGWGARQLRPRPVPHRHAHGQDAQGPPDQPRAHALEAARPARGRRARGVVSLPEDRAREARRLALTRENTGDRAGNLLGSVH
jgi:hypothetical protein